MALVACWAPGCAHASRDEQVSRGAATALALPATRRVAELVYDGALGPGWQDGGWAPHDAGHGPASVDFSGQGGWMLVKPTLTGRFGGLQLRVKSPPGEAEFLEIHLDSTRDVAFPRIKVRADQKADLGDGWEQVFVSSAELNPEGVPFDRIVLRAFRDIPHERVLIDKIALIAAPADAGPDTSSPVATAKAVMRVDCKATAKRISPLIYGIAWDSRSSTSGVRSLGATARRWGGNPTSRYNWALGAWNTANDWFFENVNVAPYTAFIDDNQKLGLSAALTVPMIGWVAKDTTSYSFPVSVFGAQQRTDPQRADAGNGFKPDGAPIPPGNPDRTSVRASPEFVGQWIEALRDQSTKAGKRLVDIVILDNEPMLWNSTQRDVHPDAVGYDELLKRSIEYASAVRKADPGLRIAGPAAWGWPAYQYSAKDAAAGFQLRPDRRAHGDTPLVPWYLAQLKAQSAKTGTRLLDLLDLHFYPQGEKVYSSAADPQTAALRIRQTRGLWDETYKDESWIGEPIYLLPRMRRWIDQNWPGTGLMIGEWSFGGERDMSGALATAEALGRFAQFGVTAAFYWVAPPPDSPTAMAFRAYRNFDGNGGRFEDYLLPANASQQTSLFASRDGAGDEIVLVALNFSPDASVSTEIDMGSCGAIREVRARSYAGHGVAFRDGKATSTESGIQAVLPAYSITVLDVRLASPLSAPVE